MLLEVRCLDSFYGDFQSLFGVDFHIKQGETVALVGANGAGKTTFLKCLAGLIDRKHGAIRFGSDEIGTLPAETIARRGLTLVPEGRRLFASLTVEENLLLGGLVGRPGFWNLGRVYELFPLLAERRCQMPGTLSGGQQGIVALGRALMSNPQLLLCDEISLGLAPAAVERAYASFGDIRALGTSIIVVEQNVQRAIAAADRLYCLLEGRVTLHVMRGQVDSDQLARAYFGA
jgi:branched-chain amino acid transport system ATP-binding protein